MMGTAATATAAAGPARAVPDQPTLAQQPSGLAAGFRLVPTKVFITYVAVLGTVPASAKVIVTIAFGCISVLSSFVKRRKAPSDPSLGAIEHGSGFFGKSFPPDDYTKTRIARWTGWTFHLAYTNPGPDQVQLGFTLSSKTLIHSLTCGSTFLALTWSQDPTSAPHWVSQSKYILPAIAMATSITHVMTNIGVDKFPGLDEPPADLDPEPMPESAYELATNQPTQTTPTSDNVDLQAGAQAGGTQAGAQTGAGGPAGAGEGTTGAQPEATQIDVSAGEQTEAIATTGPSAWWTAGRVDQTKMVPPPKDVLINMPH